MKKIINAYVLVCPCSGENCEGIIVSYPPDKNINENKDGGYYPVFLIKDEAVKESEKYNLGGVKRVTLVIETE